MKNKSVKHLLAIIGIFSIIILAFVGAILAIVGHFSQNELLKGIGLIFMFIYLFAWVGHGAGIIIKDIYNNKKKIN